MKTIKYQQTVSVHIDYLTANVYDVVPELLFKFVPKMKGVTCDICVRKFPEEDELFKSYEVMVYGEITIGNKNCLTKYPSSSYFLELQILPKYLGNIQCDFDDNDNDLEIE